MSRRCIGLIGHSGAGKSACLRALRIRIETADMDASIGRLGCPSLDDALNWLVSGKEDSRVLAISNHEEMLVQMSSAKLSKRDSHRFDSFLLTYLHKPLAEIRRDLSRLTDGGVARDAPGVKYTIENYSRLHALYAKLADRTVACEGKSVETVAAEVWAIASRLDENSP
jgi:ATPase subunit of ABC transporter with duplicated ATPase domains